MFGRTNAERSGEVRKKLRALFVTPTRPELTTYLFESSHLRATHQKPRTTQHPHPALIPPKCSSLAAAVVQKRNAHARRRQQQNPTHKKPLGGTGNVPIHTQDQATALVQIIHAIRATRSHGTADWHPKAIEKTLFENRTHQAPYGEIVVALTRYAKDSDKRVPSFLFDALADWHEPGTVAPKNPCEDHGFPAHNCHSCKADILVGDRPPEFMGKHYDIPVTGLE